MIPSTRSWRRPVQRPSGEPVTETCSWLPPLGGSRVLRAIFRLKAEATRDRRADSEGGSHEVNLSTCSRAPAANSRPPTPASARTTPARMAESHGNTNVFSSANAATRGLRLVQSITTPEKSSPAWLPSAFRYPERPPLATTSGTAQTATPSAAAATDPMRIRSGTADPGSSRRVASRGAVSTTVWERIPIASPARNPPASSARGEGSRSADQPAGSARTTTDRAAIATHSPSTSLSGRSDVNQKSGDAAAIVAASAGRHGCTSSVRHRPKTRRTSAAPPIALHNASPRTSGEATPAARSNGVASLPSAMNTGYPGGCGWCWATSKSRTPRAKLIASMSSSVGGSAAR